MRRPGHKESNFPSGSSRPTLQFPPSMSARVLVRLGKTGRTHMPDP